MNQLFKRLLFSSLFVGVTVFAVFLAPVWFFVLFIEIFVLTGLFEFLTLATRKGVRVFRPVTLIGAALIPFAMMVNAEALVFVAMLFSFFIIYFNAIADPHKALLGIGVTIFGVFYVAWTCFHIIGLRELAQGPLWVIYTILIVKGGDSAAYFVGKKWGKKKLMPTVSPNKSQEGAIASFIATILFSVLFVGALDALNVWHAVILGAFVSLLAQVGDLGESLFKRDVDIKDSGTIPGLGGILDILDSLILTIPLVYFYAILVLGVGA